MKKILLCVGLTLMAVGMSAGVYTYDSGTGTYLYTGEPVKTFSVDFTQWATSDLPDKIYDADGATEAGNMAFVKWMINERSVQMTSGATAVKKNVAFNNGTTSDATPVKNNATTNKPRIYLPTTAAGVKSITAHMAIGTTSGRAVAVYYKDDKHASWTYVSGQTLNIQTAAKYDVAEAKLELNTVGKTSIYLQYASNDYFCILDLTMDIEPIEYTKNATTDRFDFGGTAIEDTLVIDFSKMNANKVAFNTTLGSTVHADTLLEFNHAGLYKWCYLASRKCGTGTTYGPLLCNYSNSDYNGVSTSNGASTLPATKRPTIYLPTVKHGIGKVIVEGWTNGSNNRALFTSYKKTDGSWVSLPSTASKQSFTLLGNQYTKDTIVINSRDVKDLCMSRNSTDYQFITKITVIPMPYVEITIDEAVDNSAILTQYDGQKVDKLIVKRNLVGGMYNTFCLPCTVKVADFKEAVGQDVCDLRYFNEAVMEDNNLMMNFTTSSTINAGVPYLIKLEDDVTTPIELTDVTIVNNARNIAKPNSTTPLAKFFATFSPKQLNASNNTLVLSTENTLYYVDQQTSMNGLRGTFSLYNEAAKQSVQCQVRYVPTISTNIEETIHQEGCNKYMKDGQLIIVRDGVEYNAQGARL